MATKRTITLNELNLDITYSVKDDSVRGCHTESGHNLKIGDEIVIDNYFHEIIETPTEPEKTPTEPEKLSKVSISHGNIKMGAIPSVSLPACITCNPDAPCFKKCYALRMARRYKSVSEAYARNLDILINDPVSYWLQVKAAASMARFFRYHVSGDILTRDYIINMVKTAEELPNTNFLAFTKQYHIVNEYLNDGSTIPSNLKILFSNWGDWKCENPHGLPVCEVVLKGNEPAPDWKICGGNCTECACRGVGCWEVKNGETIAIYEH